MPELDAMRLVGHLDGVAEIAPEKVEPDAERDLELVDENEEDHVDARVEACAQREAAAAARAGWRSASPPRRTGRRSHHLPHEAGRAVRSRVSATTNSAVAIGR